MTIGKLIVGLIAALSTISPALAQPTISVTALSMGGTGTSNPPQHTTIPFQLTGTGSATVNGTPTQLTVSATGSTGAHIGSVYSGTVQGSFTVSFSNPAGSIYLPFQFPNGRDAGGNGLASYTFTIRGGTGAYSGASGSLAVQTTSGGNDDGMGNPPVFWRMTGSGTMTVAPPTATSPVITSIATASGGSAISQNDWIEIKGTNLVPVGTPSNDVIWSNAPDFAAGQLPMQLNGVSVAVNGQPAFVYFFCNKATSVICRTDQINVLTPLDPVVGPVQVVVYNGTAASAPFTVQKQTESPIFLLFDKGYIVATHADNGLLGPTSLYPGFSTPSKPGETIVLYGVGFGLTTASVEYGSATQSGTLPAFPVCEIGGSRANVVAAVLVSPGLYAFGVVVPTGAASGDNQLLCTYNGTTTAPGKLIAVL